MTNARRRAVILVALALAWGPSPTASAQPAPPAPGPSPGQKAAPATPDAALGDIAAIRELIDRGRAADAVARLEQALAISPTRDPRVRQLLGVALYHADRYPQAIDALRAALPGLVDGTPEHREAEQVLGLSLYLSGRLAEAVPLLERTREWAGDNRELLYTLGNAYIQLQRGADARGAFARAFSLDPESAAAHVIAAQMMTRLEMEALAETELRQALAKDSAVPHAHYLLAQMAIFRGRLDEGLELTRREVSINPSNAMAYYQLGDALVRKGQWQDAIGALQQSLWLNPYYSGPYILLGRAYVKLGQLPTAEGMLRRAIDYDPNNRAAHYSLAQVLQQLGRQEEAKREFEAAERLQGPR